MQRKNSVTLQPLKNNRAVFRRLYKYREAHSLSQNNLASSTVIRQPKTIFQAKKNNKITPVNKQQTPKNLQVNDKVSRTLSQINFKHHNEETCFCGACECGRHQCKLKTIKPQFKKRTSYSLHYDKKILPKNLGDSIIFAKQTSPLKGDSLVKKSTYGNDFQPQKLEKADTPKPSDNLKQSGPIQTITSYSNQFRNFGGINQYVRPTDRYTIGTFPFCSKTTYSKQFVSKKIRRSQSLKNDDMIKSGKMWLGQSVYSVNFINPNQKQEVIKNPILQKSGKVLKNPDFMSRFSTSYRRQFQRKQPALCPIKTTLNNPEQFEKKSILLNLLNQNADYRGLNPQFKAIATSRHYYV